MMYVLYGADEKAAREKLSILIKHLREKRPDAEYVRMTEEEYALATVLEYGLRQGLFERKSIVLLDHLLQKKETGEGILQNLENIASSENVFILLEGDLDTKTADRMKKYAVKVQEFEKNPVRGEIVPFNIFSVSNAFSKRDKKAAWTLYMQALHKGIAAEAIQATVLSQMKSILVASGGRLKIGKYTKKDLEDICRRLLMNYHDSRRGLVDIETMLELEILAL